MNIQEIKNVIDELIYESVIGKNPFKVGDLVKLRPDVVGRFGKRVPAHAGFSRTQQSWIKTLENLIDKTGKVKKVFSDSKHINVEYPQSWTSKDDHNRSYTVNSIGIDYTELIPADRPETKLKEVNYTTDKSTGKPTISVGAPNSLARFAAENSHIIKAAREWVKDCQWQDVCEPGDVDEMSDIEILQGVNKHYEGGIRQFIIDSEPHQNSEGFGAVYDKDRAKDPKSIKIPGGGTEHWRIKYQSTSDLNKHGNTEKSKVSNEQISVSEVKNVIQELIKEMWVGWEEEEEGKTDDKLKKKEISESENPDKKYIIWALSGPAPTYYVNSPTQGERMVQFGQSIATRFDTEQQVRHKILQLKQKYKGIKKWEFEIAPRAPNWEDAWKPFGPKVFKLGHQISKPVKKGDEYVVKWMIDGKRDEGKTYYTDDKKDANDTYLTMLKQAAELNQRGV